MKDGREERLDASALLSRPHRDPLSVDAISRFAEVESENFFPSTSAAHCGLADSAGRSQQDPYQGARCAGVTVAPREPTSPAAGWHDGEASEVKP